MSDPVISVQLWSVRDALAADVGATFDRLASIGFRHVEAFGFVDRVDEIAAALARTGISCPTGHASLASAVENPFDLSITRPTNAAVFAAANALGMTVVIDPFVAPDRWTTLADITATAELLNAAAVEAAPFGITVGYHNHNQEFHAKIDGRFALETFAELLDPSVVIELDLYWALSGGADVVGLLERLGDRVIALHVKDGSLSPLPTIGELPTDQLPAGEGVVPLAAALDAATNAKYAIVEFDHFEGDIWQGLTASRAFLTARGLA
jgi:sugar phosphate isomerase/epimerase